MNLHDIVKRKDPIMVIESGSAEPVHRGGDDGYIGARVSPGTRIRFVDVPLYSALRLGERLGWQVIEGDADIALGRDEIIVRSEGGAIIRSGSYWEARGHIIPFATGNGIEVGPGGSPHIKPSRSTQVRYLENVEKEEWIARYHADSSTESKSAWTNYLVGDAQTLSVIDNGSLDFIYSNHVFEHLMNPLGVLAAWSAKLRHGGSVLAVIPDCRYCFDFRQEPSTLAEFQQEFDEERWEPARDKYEKWCAGTMVGGDPDSFIRRTYPIHFHYYTPSVFGELAGKAIELGLFGNVTVWARPNTKDFAIRLVKKISPVARLRAALGR